MRMVVNEDARSLLFKDIVRCSLQIQEKLTGNTSNSS